MRRKHEDSYIEPTFFIPLQDLLSIEQWAGIGRVAIAYNHAERSLFNLFYTSSKMAPTIKRGENEAIINYKIKEIIRIAKICNVHRRVQSIVGKTLSDHEFIAAKQIRNSVIHLTTIDRKHGVGLHEGADNKYEILLTESSLLCLFNVLIAYSREISKIEYIFKMYHNIQSCRDSDERKKRYEESILSSLVTLEQIRSDRLSLPAYPELPDLPPFPQGSDQQEVDSE